MENLGGHTFLCFRGAEGEGRRTCVGSGFLTLPQEEVSFLLSRASAFQTNVISELEPEVLSHVTHELPGCDSPGEVSGCQDLLREFVTWAESPQRPLALLETPTHWCVFSQMALRHRCHSSSRSLTQVLTFGTPYVGKLVTGFVSLIQC